MCKCLVCLLVTGDFRPGDPRPSGYNDFFEWCRVQERAGHRMKSCSHCCKWWYDFEDCGCKNATRHTLKQLRSIDAQIRRQLKAEGNSIGPHDHD